jgi:predicted dehydrogenase
LKLKTVFVGLNSDHLWPVWGKGVIREVQETGKYELVAAADKNPELLERIEKEFGVKKTYSSYQEMFRKESFDVVVVGVPNNEKADVVVAAAEKEANLLIDKPLSANLEQANRILRATEKHGVKGLVYYPGVYDPRSYEAHRLATDGTIGKIFQIEARVANSGPEHHGCSKYFLEWLFNKEKNGGGALIDYCCYGALYSRWFIGQPEGVVGVGGRYVKDNIEAEDNATLLLRYPKALSIIQASWSEFASDTAWKAYCGPKLAVYGSNGSIIWRRHADETLTLITKDYPEGKEIRPTPPSKEKENAPEYLAYCILNDKPVGGGGNLQICRDVQEIIEAGYRSIESRKEVRLPIK